jgi:hypothetical protein
MEERSGAGNEPHEFQDLNTVFANGFVIFRGANNLLNKSGPVVRPLLNQNLQEKRHVSNVVHFNNVHNTKCKISPPRKREKCKNKVWPTVSDVKLGRKEGLGIEMVPKYEWEEWGG